MRLPATKAHQDSHLRQLLNQTAAYMMHKEISCSFLASGVHLGQVAVQLDVSLVFVLANLTLALAVSTTRSCCGPFTLMATDAFIVGLALYFRVIAQGCFCPPQA